jgi:hypothetical protein
MSFRKDWEAHEKALARMAIKPKIFKGDLGDALDAWEAANRAVEKDKANDPKALKKLKEARTEKYTNVKGIMGIYSNYLTGLEKKSDAETTPMQRTVIAPALEFLGLVIGVMGKPENKQ